MATEIDDDFDDFMFPDEDMEPAAPEEPAGHDDVDPLSEPGRFDEPSEPFDFSAGGDPSFGGSEADIDYEESSGTPKWVWFAGGGLLLLALLVVAATTVLGDGSQPAGEAVASETAVEPTATETGQTEAATSEAQAEPSSTATASQDPADSLLAADSTSVLAALDVTFEKWGEFADTGDLAVLENYFATDGPQFAFESSRAEEVVPSAPDTHRFSLVGDPELSVEEDIALVVADVQFDRVEGAETVSEAFTWEIEMRRQDGLWLLWTVTSVVTGQE